jgi:hypothetical protein
MGRIRGERVSAGPCKGGETPVQLFKRGGGGGSCKLLQVKLLPFSGISKRPGWLMMELKISMSL